MRRVIDQGVRRWWRQAALVACVAALAACSGDESSSPEPTGDAATPTTAGTGPDVGGLAARFGTIVVDLVTASGEVLELCLLDAEDPTQRSQGLRDVTDLEGHDGMLFRWDDDTEGNFVMIDTVLPLTISWWAGDGSFVSDADMTPCTEADDADCTRYTADRPYRDAIEVVEGSLPDAGPGARIEPRPGSSCQRG